MNLLAIGFLVLSLHTGVVVDHKDQVLGGVTVIARAASGESRTTTDDVGQFSIDIPDEEITLRVEGRYIKPQEQIVTNSENIRIKVDYEIPPIQQSVVITASALEPQVETHSDEVFKKSLFSRDAQRRH